MNPSLFFSTLNLVLGGLVFLLGFVILRENPGQRLNRIVSLMLFFGGLGAILAAVAFLAARPGAPPEASGMLSSVAYVWEFYFPTLFLFAAIFPEERPWIRTPPWRRWGSWLPGFGTLVFAPHVFHFVLALVLTAWEPVIKVPASGFLSYLAPAAALLQLILRLFLIAHQGLFSLVNLGFGAAAMLLLINSYRRTEVPRLRLQMRVVAVGLSASLVLYAFATLIPTLLGVALPENVRSGLTIAALTLGPGSIAWAIVRYKFLDAKLLARRGILYALASALMVGVYLLVVGRLNQVVASLTGIRGDVFEPVFLVVALALFHPVVARLEEQLDRVFMKDPGDYRNVLRRLGQDLQTTIDLDVLLERTLATVAESLLARRVTLVAYAREGAIVRSAGEALRAGDEARLLALLPELRGEATSYRLPERVEGLAPESIEFLHRGLRTVLLVPLRWRGEQIGVLLMSEKVLETPYSSEDVSLLVALAGQLAVSLQNALLLRERLQVARIEEELVLAREIQRKSLISEFPRMRRCEVHALYSPSRHVGGDFYDVVADADGGFLIAIADVSGKGMPAALLSAMLQASLRTQARGTHGLSGILKNINGLLFESTSSHQFATFFLARLDGESLRLSFCNAGHNWPVVIRARGGRTLLEEGGTILGVLDEVEFEEADVVLDPGDLVVFYTDGISEATNPEGEMFGEERLYALLHAMPRELGARAVAEHLLEEVRRFLGGADAQDDITVLVLRALEPSPAEKGTPLEIDAVTVR